MRDVLEGILVVFAALIVVVVVLVVLFTGVCMACNATYAGTVVEYKGTVQTVTRNSFLAPHTVVVLRTYSEDNVSFTLNGYHDFDIGKQYTISVTMRLYLYGLACWGELEAEG